MASPAKPANQSWREIFLENTLDAVVGIDTNSSIIDWNKEAQNIFGWSKEEALGKNLSEIVIPPEHRAGHVAGIQHYLKTGEGPILNKRVELEAVRASGERFPVELTVTPLESQGKILFYAFLRDISARHHLEQELRNQREQMHNILMQAPSAISIRRGDDFSYQFVNPVYLEILGKKPEEIIGKKADEIFDPEQNKAAMQITRNVYQTGEPFIGNEFPINISNPDTQKLETRYFNFIQQPFYDHGKIDGVMTFGHEVTKAVLARRQVEASESLLRLIMDSTQAFISFMDREERYRFVNRQYEETFGLKSDQIQGKQVWEIIGQEAYQRSKPFYTKAFKGERGHTEVTIKDKYGNPIILEVQYIPLIQNQQVQGIAIIALDITERKQIENDQLLIAQVAAVTAKVQSVPELITEVTTMLAQHLKVSRCWLSEVIEGIKVIVHHDYSLNLPSLAGSYDLKVFGDEIVKCWLSNQLVSVEDVTTDPRSSGDAPAHHSLGIGSFISLPLHRGGKLKAFLNVAAENKRQWKKSEQELICSVAENMWPALENLRLLNELKEAIRYRDEFISICSHELKTPITSMKLQFQLAEKQLQMGNAKVYAKAAVEKRIKLVNKQIDRMAKLIDDMLDVARISAGKFEIIQEPVNMGQLVEEVLGNFEEQFKILQLPVKLEVSSQELLVTGDKYRLEQVISNLLTNAIKYGDSKPIQVRVFAQADSILVSVEDQGQGIAPENLQRIFLRFERVISSHNISGLGLGLHISGQIIEAHQGKITVESSPGRGSKFTIQLPAHKR